MSNTRLLPKILFFAAALLAACTSNPPATKPEGPRFEFADTPPPLEMKSVTNWCIALYSEGVAPILERNNYNRRSILLKDDTVYKVVVMSGNLPAMMFLRKTGPETVEISRQSNFPHCLPEDKFWTLGDAGRTFVFDNGLNIRYTGEIYVAAGTNGGLLVTIGLPKDANYGMEIHRCDYCPAEGEPKVKRKTH
jgi:hypothetical protein